MDNVVNITDKIQIDHTEDAPEAPEIVEEKIEAAPEPIENPAGAMEAILFSMGDSVAIDKLAAVIGRDKEETLGILQDIQKKYDKDANRGITLTFLEGTEQVWEEAGVDEACLAAAICESLTTFIPAMSGVAIRIGDKPLTAVNSEKFGAIPVPDHRLFCAGGQAGACGEKRGQGRSGQPPGAAGGADGRAGCPGEKRGAGAYAA